MEQMVLELLEKLNTQMLQGFAELKAGQARLEGDFAEMKDRLIRLEGDVTELKAGQARLEDEVAELRAGQARLEGEVAELRAGQARLEGEIAEVKSKQTQLWASIAELKAGQARLEKQLTLLENELKPKIEAALDGYKLVLERLEILEKKVDKLARIVERHDLEIEVLRRAYYSQNS